MTVENYSGGEQGSVGIATSWRPEDVLSPPATPSPTTATTGGSVLAGAYGVKVSYVNANGETLASAAGTVTTTGSTSTITVPSPASVTGATGWYAYVTQLGGSTYTRQQAPGSPTAIATALTLTAPPTSSGSAPPATNTTSGDPTVVVAPTQWTLTETDTLDSVPIHIQRDVYAESRDADKGHRTGKYDVGGQIGGGLYPTNMIEAEIAAIGGDAFTAAPGSADTTTSIATAGNRTTMVLSGSPAAYAPPDLITVDTGALQECRPVISYDSGTKTLVIPALFKSHTSSGTAVKLLPQILTQPYSKISGFSKYLRRLSVEDHVGDQEAYAYPDTQVGKYAIKASASKFDVTMDLVMGAQRVQLDSPNAYDGTDPSLDDLSFEFTDGFMVFPDDPTSSGTPTVQLVSDGQDWGLDLDNGMKKADRYDGTDTYKYVPGLRKVMITFKKLTQSNYPVLWKKFLTRNLDIPWFSFVCLNVGTDTVPVWQAKCYYCPNVRVTKAKPIKSLNDIVGEDIEAIAREANGQAKLYVSCSDPAITATL